MKSTPAIGSVVDLYRAGAMPRVAVPATVAGVSHHHASDRVTLHLVWSVSAEPIENVAHIEDWVADGSKQGFHYWDYPS